MIRYRGSHRLDGVVDVVQAGIDDRLAQRLEAFHVEHDVVVYDKDRSRASIVSVANVGDHAIERVSEEVAPAHLDDRTEAAIEGAPSRRFDHVNLTAKNRVALEHSR